MNRFSTLTGMLNEIWAERQADDAAANRASDRHTFFCDFDRLHSESDVDASELAEREKELGITQDDWDSWRESKEKAEAQF